MLADIQEIIIITNSLNLNGFKLLLNDGNHLGIKKMLYILHLMDWQSLDN
tara:strand:- start:957 stop:1106 length:150 start_codon:yes stop_codon:yes gene_type:complete